MPKVWRRGGNTGAYSVPMWEPQEGEGRREWARKEGMRWDSWDALASKKWVRMEESGRVDDEDRLIVEKVDLMEAFFAGVHRQI